jgi:hypothetical protein
MNVNDYLIHSKMRISQRLFQLIIFGLFLVSSGVSLGAQSTVGSDQVFFTRELCPPGSQADECLVVSTFSLQHEPYSIAIIENYSFRTSTFGIAKEKASGWELITAGPLMDLEVMAYSPADPFAYDNYPGVLVEVPPVVLFELLQQVASYFDELYKD